MREFNKEEEKVNDLIADAWNAFMQLDKSHPHELEEFRNAVHVLQGLMACRIVYPCKTTHIRSKN